MQREMASPMRIRQNFIVTEAVNSVPEKLYKTNPDEYLKKKNEALKTALQRPECELYHVFPSIRPRSKGKKKGGGPPPRPNLVLSQEERQFRRERRKRKETLNANNAGIESRNEKELSAAGVESLESGVAVMGIFENEHGEPYKPDRNEKLNDNNIGPERVQNIFELDRSFIENGGKGEEYSRIWRFIEQNNAVLACVLVSILFLQ